MKSKEIALRSFPLFIMILMGTTVQACTTFCLQKNGKIVFGRNYDWVTGIGMIHTNLRGLKKTALTIEEGSQLSWTSNYGSVSFNQYGKEFPNGGMNEKGLVVELMWLNDSQYPQKDQRPSLSVLQWIQYQLDKAATVDEVIASDKKIRIFSTGTPQHYLVADGKGSVATIEFLDGKMVVHRGRSLPYPVLSNTNYHASVKALQQKNSRSDNSLQRFSSACEKVNFYQANNVSTPLVDYAFNILDEVAQGDFTKWSIVYDISNKTIHFRTSEGKERKFLVLPSFSFNCDSSPKMYNLMEHHRNDVTAYFKVYEPSVNTEKLQQAFLASSGQVNIPASLQKMMAAIPEKNRCLVKMD